MAALLISMKRFWKQVIFEDDQGFRVGIISIAIIITSSSLIAILGLNALFIPFLALILFLNLRYGLFAMALYLASIPFIMLFYFQVYIAVSLVFAMFIIVLWAIRKIANKETATATSNSLLAFSLVFFGAGLISGFNNGITGPELKTLVRLIIFFLLIFVIYDQYHPRHTLLLFTAMTLPLIFSSFMLFKEYSQVRDFVSLLDLYRLKPGGVFPNSNLLGYVLMVAIPFWIAIGIWYRDNIVRIMSFGAAIIMSIALILTNSRASILGFAIAIMMFFIWARKIKYLIFLILAIVLIFISMPAIRNVISLGLRFERGTTSRDVIWANSIELIRKNPVLGIGLGNYPSEYDPYFNTAYERGFMKTVPNAHLFFLSMVVDLGIAGFFLALVLYILPIREAMNALKNAKSIQDKAMTYGVLAGILSIFARSFFETGGIVGSGRPYPDILFWLLFCILLKINRPVKEPADKMCFLPIRGKS